MHDRSPAKCGGATSTWGHGFRGSVETQPSYLASWRRCRVTEYVLEHADVGSACEDYHPYQA